MEDSDDRGGVREYGKEETSVPGWGQKAIHRGVSKGNIFDATIRRVI